MDGAFLLKARSDMMTRKRISILWLPAAALAAMCLVGAGCRERPAPPEKPAETAKPAEAPPPSPPPEVAKEKPKEKPMEEAKPAAKPSRAALLNPAQLNERAPETYVVKLDTSKGTVRIQVERSWAPLGADRFYNLVKNGFYDGARFFRIVPNFVVQFGLNGDPAVNAKWEDARIKDDPVTKTNRKGAVTFATAGPNTRTTQVFINLRANAFLDQQGFAPFGQVIEGMEVIEGLYAGYGEAPDQGLIRTQGNAYLTKRFPNLDYIKTAVIE
jgi:peptidyl-prolyl cis-trans isomerase A (cyclophilin A)